MYEARYTVYLISYSAVKILFIPRLRPNELSTLVQYFPTISMQVVQKIFYAHCKGRKMTND